MAPALELRGLCKSYGKPAVDRLDLCVPAGELYALLGPNGAGKTTTLRMVAGLLRPDAGEIHIFGIDALADPISAKRIVAWLPGLWSVDPPAAQKRADDLLQLLDLSENRNQRCESFSRGMKQKTALACALIHDPKLLILDEPLTGLDAAVARQVKDLLQQRVREGGTVIMTTHILDVAERVAERIGIIQAGRLRAEGTLSELRGRSGLGDSTLEDVYLELTGTGV
jgi:ABC-2 type transport system ATP-binding protein